MADNEEPLVEPLNEWVVSEWSRVLDQLRDLMRRHEEIVNHLADVCRRNDKMQAAGDTMRDLLDILWTFPGIEDSKVKEAIQNWNDANA